MRQPHNSEGIDVHALNQEPLAIRYKLVIHGLPGYGGGHGDGFTKLYSTFHSSKALMDWEEKAVMAGLSERQRKEVRVEKWVMRWERVGEERIGVEREESEGKVGGIGDVAPSADRGVE